MNKAYKVVFNEITGTYVAVAEIVSARGKASSAQENTTSITAVPASVTGRFMGKVMMALLGLTTALAMPLAHASWSNNGNGGGSSPSNAFASTSSTGIGIGSDTTAAGKASAGGAMPLQSVLPRQQVQMVQSLWVGKPVLKRVRLMVWP